MTNFPKWQDVRNDIVADSGGEECVDLRVTQFTSQTWGVHAVLPDGLLSLARMTV